MLPFSPKTTNKFVEKLLDKIGCDFDPEQVPVIVEPYSTIDNCFINVDKKIEKDGGGVHYGWTIYQSDIICEAERHAVWESPNGDLIDITPKKIDFAEIMFVSDNNFKYEGQLVDNIRINITGRRIVDDFIFLCENLEGLWVYGTRIDDEKIELPPPIASLISNYEQLKEIYLVYIRSGGGYEKQCFCGNSKYAKCHGATIRKQIRAEVAKATRSNQNDSSKG